MKARQIALKLFLDHLDVPAGIRTFDDRKRVQKAIYLAQRAGVPIGYRFGWYLKGPYCASLTQDYYDLAGAMALGEKDHEDKELKAPVRERLDKVRPLMNKPEWFNRSPEDWLELVASLDYLLKVRKFSIRQAKAVFREEKPLLSKYVPEARKALKKAGLAR